MQTAPWVVLLTEQNTLGHLKAFKRKEDKRVGAEKYE
jgi:hypothetical protein